MITKEMDELEDIAAQNDIHARHEGERRGKKIGQDKFKNHSIANRSASRRHKNIVTLAGGEVKIK